jgi:hypothetical protein
MKKFIAVSVFMLLAGGMVSAQSWSDMTKEEKLMSAKKFQTDNQNYLRNTLGLNDDQINDINNVNACYLSTLDRIGRYGKTDEAKLEAAKAITAARSVQLDAIMGPEKRDQFMEYVGGKLAAMD